MSGPLVLGIESSCDETGVGIVRGHELLANEVASSVEEHVRFGGVVPEMASRAHLEAMLPTLERACATADVDLTEIDAIAVTAGPGLMGALVVGVAAAKALAYALGKPLYGVNHLAGHVAVDLLEHGPLPSRCVALLVSGGHTSLLLVDDIAGAPADRRARRHHRRRGGGGVRQGRPAARPALSGRAGHRPGARRATRGAIAFPRGLTRRATWSGTASTSPSPGSRPPSPAGSRRASGRARRAAADVAAQLPGGRLRRADGQGGRRLRGDRGAAPADRRRGGRQQPAAGAAGRTGRRGRADPADPAPGLCTDNGAMIAVLGSEVVTAGGRPSGPDLGADSSLPVSRVLV